MKAFLNLASATADDYGPQPGEVIYVGACPDIEPQPGERVTYRGSDGPHGFIENRQHRRRTRRTIRGEFPAVRPRTRRAQSQKTAARHDHGSPGWIERRRQGASGLDRWDRSRLFSIIKRVCERALGRCWRAADVTPEQHRRAVAAVIAEAQAAGLRIESSTVAGRLDFWLSLHDPAKALYFRFADLARACDIIASRLPNDDLAELNRHPSGRHIDRFVLALVLCTVVKNTLVANRRTKKEECGTTAVRRMLVQQGFGRLDDGTAVRLCMETLARVGLIRCIGHSTEIGKQCRRWVPVGAAWSLPFVANLLDGELTPTQRAERAKYQAAPFEDAGDRSHGIGGEWSTRHPMVQADGGQLQARAWPTRPFLSSFADEKSGSPTFRWN